MDPLLVCGPQIKSPGLRSLLPAHFLIFCSSLKFMIPQISVKCWLCTGQAMFCNLALTPLAQSPYSHQSHKSPLKFKGHFSICIITPSLCPPGNQAIFSLELSPSWASAVCFSRAVTQWFTLTQGAFLFYKIVPLLLLFWLHWVFVTALELFVVVRGLL